MTVPLLPPLTYSATDGRKQALDNGPAYVLGRPSNRVEQRWHRVRSGIRYTTADRTVWVAWCGQSLYAEHCVAVDNLPDGQPVCGTCHGRAEGHAGKDGLVFSPRELKTPTTCPSRSLYVHAGFNVGRCLACGELAPLRATGGPYNPQEIITRHPPLKLVEGCKFHAWRNLVAANGTAMCACQARRGQS